MLEGLFLCSPDYRQGRNPEKGKGGVWQEQKFSAVASRPKIPPCLFRLYWKTKPSGRPLLLKTHGQAAAYEAHKSLIGSVKFGRREYLVVIGNALRSTENRGSQLSAG